MPKRHNMILILAVCLAVLLVGFFSYYYSQSTPEPVTNIPVTYTTVTDNELVILHLNNLVPANKVGVQLTLTSHSKTEDSVASTVAVQAIDGSALGEINFSHIDDTQSIGDHRFRLVSATKSAIQVLVLATVAE